MAITASDVTITVNGAYCSTSAATLADLVATLGHDPNAVATAVNGEFVPRHKRGSTKLTAGDNIEIVSPRQGG